MVIIDNIIQIQRQLKKIRKEMGLTQIDIAVKIGVSQQAIAKAEKCDGTISKELLFCIANSLGYDIILRKR